MRFDEDVLLIAGPTASGKTRLAIEAAQANDAIIINTDSMQVYADLRVITARPTVGEENAARHELFGHVDAGFSYSVAEWLNEVSVFKEQAQVERRKLVFVGGTGLYFSALLDGLSPVPPIDPEIREKWRTFSRNEPGKLFSQLQALDLLMANELEKNDTQRLVRALEVMESTGRSLADWQREKGEALFDETVSVRKILLMPERKLLHERINLRFDVMIEQGALDEVRHLLARNLDPSLPAMKAIGVPHLAGFLNREYELAEAIEKAKAASRQYAKRQSTWFRNSFDDSWEINP